MEKLGNTLSNHPWSSHPPGTTAHVQLLSTLCCLSNLNSGWFITIINDDFLCGHVALQQWHSILAEHEPWRWARHFLVLSATTKQVPCMISKGWYLLPTPPARCFICSPAALHVLARNPEQYHSPFRWLCSECWELEDLPHQHGNHSGAGTNALLMPTRGLGRSYYKYHPAPFLERPAQMNIGQWLREEKARAWFPFRRRRRPTPNSSIDKWRYCVEVQVWMQVFRWWCFGKDGIISSALCPVLCRQIITPSWSPKCSSICNRWERNIL